MKSLYSLSYIAFHYKLSMAITVQKRSLFFTYLKLGYLLHLMTIAEILVIICFFQYIDVTSWLQEGFIFFKIVFLFLFVAAPIYPQCDARSRFQNYKQIKDHLYLYGFQSRIVKPFSFSRCQRDAVLVAAEELGMEKDCKQYFIDLGYRWYHILPSFLIKRPTYLFHKAFWLNTFFAKYYPAKINFSALSKERESVQENNLYFSSGSII